MLTTSHGIIGYLLYQKKSTKKKVLCVIGSVIPDVPMILIFVFFFLRTTIVEGVPIEDVSFGTIHQLLHSSWFDISSYFLHTIWLWGILAIGAIWWKQLLPLGIGGMAHIVVDFFTHTEQAFNYVYPLPPLPMSGIVDYRDPWFFVTIHLVFAVIFLPSFIRWFRLKMHP